MIEYLYYEKEISERKKKHVISYKNSYKHQTSYEVYKLL